MPGVIGEDTIVGSTVFTRLVDAPVYEAKHVTAKVYNTTSTPAFYRWLASFDDNIYQPVDVASLNDAFGAGASVVFSTDIVAPYMGFAGKMSGNATQTKKVALWWPSR